MFQAFTYPSSGENCCICVTLVFVTLYRWRLVCWLDFNPTSRPDTTHTVWHMPVSHRYKNFPLMLGTWIPETCREEKCKDILDRIVHLVGLIYEMESMGRESFKPLHEGHRFSWNFVTQRFVLLYAPPPPNVGKGHNSTVSLKFVGNSTDCNETAIPEWR